jgi:uncharacterized protein (TIGR01244 family)
MTMDLARFIPQFRQPRPQLMTGGQPEPDAWPALAKAGVTTVVNLRSATETPGRDEAGEVRAAGLTYVNLPVDGADKLGPNEVGALWQALESAPGPVLVHCGSGNRCGALLALAEAWHRGGSPEEALAFGRQSGLTGLEPAVRRLLA